MTQKSDDFFVELGMLFVKYGVSIDGHDEYDGGDNYCGTEWELWVDGRTVSIKELAKVLRDVRRVWKSPDDKREAG